MLFGGLAENTSHGFRINVYKDKQTYEENADSISSGALSSAALDYYNDKTTLDLEDGYIVLVEYGSVIMTKGSTTFSFD